MDSGSDRSERLALPPGASFLFGLASRGVCLASLVTQSAGELLPHRFTLTYQWAEGSVRRSVPGRHLIFHQLPSALCQAVYFLLHFPGPCGRWALPTTVSCEARTFLPKTRRVRASSGHPAHSEPHTTIADTFRRGKVLKPGLGVTADCAEGLQDWETAESYFNATAERYDGNQTEWYFFCRRNGKGRVEAATVTAEKAIRRYANSKNAVNMHEVLYELVEPQHELLLLKLKTRAETWAEAPIILLTALLANDEKDVATRDAMFARVQSESALDAASRGDVPPAELIYLASLFTKDLAAGGECEFDLNETMAIGRSASLGDSTPYYYLLREYLRLRGKPDDAIASWTEVMAQPFMGSAYRTLAGVKLLQAGQGPRCTATNSTRSERYWNC